MMQALALYRAQFRPSAQLEQPYVMLGVNVFAADTDERGAPAVHVGPAGVREPAPRTSPAPLPPPVDELRDADWRRRSSAMLEQALACSFVGIAGDGAPRAARRSSPAPAPTS